MLLQGGYVCSVLLSDIALAYLLQNEGKADVEYYSSQEDSYLENNFLNRYFTMKGPDNNTIKVGYRNGELIVYKHIHCRNNVKFSGRTWGFLCPAIFWLISCGMRL